MDPAAAAIDPAGADEVGQSVSGGYGGGVGSLPHPRGHSAGGGERKGCRASSRNDCVFLMTVIIQFGQISAFAGTGFIISVVVDVF